MKFERLGTWGGLLIIFCYFQWRLCDEGECELEVTAQGEGFELAQPMGEMQKYMDKLHFAGLEGNWQLAGFYLHEIEEQAEKIVEAGVHEGEVDVSAYTRKLLISKIEELESSVEAEDGAEFSKGYIALVARCNSCHQMSNHGFIQIKVPDLSMFKNQRYKAFRAKN